MRQLIRADSQEGVEPDAEGSGCYEPHDMAAGRRVGSIDLTKVEEPKGWSLSPDGKHLLITETKGLGLAGDHTVHLISMADGKDIDWMPFPENEKTAVRLALFRAEMVSNDRIVAVGTNRANVLLPAGQPIGTRARSNRRRSGSRSGKERGPRPDNVPRIQWQVAFTAERRKWRYGTVTGTPSGTRPRSRAESAPRR